MLVPRLRPTFLRAIRSLPRLAEPSLEAWWALVAGAIPDLLVPYPQEKRLPGFDRVNALPTSSDIIFEDCKSFLYSKKGLAVFKHDLASYMCAACMPRHCLDLQPTVPEQIPRDFSRRNHERIFALYQDSSLDQSLESVRQGQKSASSDCEYCWWKMQDQYMDWHKNRGVEQLSSLSSALVTVDRERLNVSKERSLASQNALLAEYTLARVFHYSNMISALRKRYHSTRSCLKKGLVPIALLTHAEATTLLRPHKGNTIIKFGEIDPQLQNLNLFPVLVHMRLQNASYCHGQIIGAAFCRNGVLESADFCEYHGKFDLDFAEADAHSAKVIAAHNLNLQQHLQLFGDSVKSDIIRMMHEQNSELFSALFLSMKAGIPELQGNICRAFIESSIRAERRGFADRWVASFLAHPFRRLMCPLPHLQSTNKKMLACRHILLCLGHERFKSRKTMWQPKSLWESAFNLTARDVRLANIKHVEDQDIKEKRLHALIQSGFPSDLPPHGLTSCGPIPYQFLLRDRLLNVEAGRELKCIGKGDSNGFAELAEQLRACKPSMSPNWTERLEEVSTQLKTHC